MVRRISAVLVAGMCFLPIMQAKTQTAAKRAVAAQMPVTTSSAKARDLFQRAVQDYELLYLERANIGWRAATKEDPQFAQAFAMLAMNSRDPEEVRACRERAQELAPQASAGERLMIQWIVNVQEGNYLAGIASMNDMIAMFPRDKHVYYYAANWLMGTQGNEQAHHLLHKALEIDPNFAPGLNNMAYLHARDRNFTEALQDMERYVKLLPKEPNPQDSYGEISRMAGQFDAALEHYRAALKIDPNFNTSQVGLGDTYALMGDQEHARREYDKAIQQEPNLANRFDYRMQKATSWVREKNYTQADREFWLVATEAHAQSYELQEAQAFRRMAQYQPEDKLALERLGSAEDALTHRKNLTPADRDEELSHILRLRVGRALHVGQVALARQALQQLEKMATGNRNRVIQESWHGAAGEMLVAEGKYQEAIAELEEDQDNPATLALLVKAYGAVGETEKRLSTENRLKNTNLPTLEQALSVQAKAAQVQGTL